MYFSPSRIQKTIEKFYKCMCENAYLVLGQAEASHGNHHQLKKINSNQRIYFLKDNQCPPLPSDFYQEAHSISIKSPPKGLTEIGNKTSIPAPTKANPPSLAVDEKFVSEKKSSPNNSKRELLIKRNLQQIKEKTPIEKTSFGPEPPKESFLFIRTNANQGKLGQALEYALKIQNQFKLNPTLHYLIATILIEQGKTDEAIDQLHKTIYLNPEFVLSYFTLGNIYLNQDKPSLCKKYFQSALNVLSKLKPNEIIPESDGITAKRLEKIIKRLPILIDDN